jgi:hypothetical protein
MPLPAAPLVAPEPAADPVVPPVDEAVIPAIGAELPPPL